MTERIPCKTAGCKATILPATAAKTGGYCMPCHQEQERQKRQSYIEQHRRTVNLYEGLTDPVEILKIMHVRAPYDPLVQYVPYPLSKEQLYVGLTAEQAVKMQEYAVKHLAEGDKDTAENILLSLVCYRNDNIAGVLPDLMEHGIYYPAILYKDAPSGMRDRLLRQVDWDEENRNYILLILGWIGDSRVVGAFRKWRGSPPEWTKQLYVAPESYALDGGWELTTDGERRDLVHNLNYAIEITKELKGIDAEGAGDQFLTPSASACSWCGGKLTLLMDVNTSHPSLAYLSLPQDRLRVQTCERCGCFGTVYMELDSLDTPFWSRYNQKPDYLPAFDLTADSSEGIGEVRGTLALSPAPRSPYYAAEWALSQHDSQIGGHPGWVQDAEYPKCPCCAKHMRFIAQVDWADFGDGEGIFYMFLCLEDMLTATVYQQS
ncbi:hypothetical protein D3C87_536140 [compost metagenome]